MQNADFSQTVPFVDGHNMATKDYSMAISSDAGVVATTLKSDDTGSTSGARLIKTAGLNDTGLNAAGAEVETYLTIYIPADGPSSGSLINTFGTMDFADGFEGTWELLEVNNGTPAITIRQAEGEIIVRTGVTPFLAYTDPP